MREPIPVFMVLNGERRVNRYYGEVVDVDGRVVKKPLHCSGLVYVV